MLGVHGHDHRGKVVVVTGGGNGIGRALCRRFAAEGAKAIVVADVNARRGAAGRGRDRRHRGRRRRVAGSGRRGAGDADDRARTAAIDLFCSNAGIAVNGDEHTPDAEWARCWDVNVMAHVYAARAVIPHMLERGGGYLLQTVSAAGLLTHPQSATYAVTKHASLAFAEWMSMTYGDRGIMVSALCPQGVRTDMLRRAEAEGTRRSFLLDSALEPEQVADDVVKGLEAERFLILPHGEVAEYVRRKAADPRSLAPGHATAGVEYLARGPRTCPIDGPQRHKDTELNASPAAIRRQRVRSGGNTSRTVEACVSTALRDAHVGRLCRPMQRVDVGACAPDLGSWSLCLCVKFVDAIAA